jgi:hypothetical protein
MVKCPNCGYLKRAPYAFLYIDTDKKFAVCYDPVNDSNVLYKGDNYCASAPRIREWEAFKRAILNFEGQYLAWRAACDRKLGLSKTTTDKPKTEGSLGPTGPTPSERPKRPQCQDFGFSEETLERMLDFRKLTGLIAAVCVPVFLFVLVVNMSKSTSEGIGIALALFILPLPLGPLIGFSVYGLAIKLIGRLPIMRKIDAYLAAIWKFVQLEEEERKRQAALEAEEKRRQAELQEEELRRKKDFWLELDGYQFERELARLFRKCGYKATETPGSGDSGVDIRLEKDGVKAVVQCKAHKRPIGPGPVRELYGVMTHEGVTKGIIACLGGFTQGAVDFAKGKSVELLGIEDVLELQSRFNAERVKTADII